MNRNYIGSLLRVLLLVAVAWGCDSRQETAHTHAQRYTCPMHPEIVRDEPGSCPICGMDLVPEVTTGETVVDSALRPLLRPTNAQVISPVSYTHLDVYKRQVLTSSTHILLVTPLIFLMTKEYELRKFGKLEVYDVQH